MSIRAEKKPNSSILYLIDENGIIAKAFGNVKAADNPGQMLNEL